MNKFFAPFVGILIVTLLVALGYFIFQNQKLIREFSQNPPQQQPPASTPTPLATPQPSPSPKITAATTQNAIKTNVAAKNYQGLVPYMADPIEVILQATECCGPKTPAAAIEQMSYLDEGMPYNFDQDQETVKNLKSKNLELADKYIGISQTKEHLVAFGLDSENKISDIRMSVSWKLFSY